MAYRNLRVFIGKTELRCFGGNGKEVLDEAKRYESIGYRKEKHPNLKQSDLEKLEIIKSK